MEDKTWSEIEQETCKLWNGREHGDDDRLWCYEPWTETYFSAKYTDILEAEIELNRRFIQEEHVWLDTWIALLNINNPVNFKPKTRGWFVDDTFCWQSSFIGYYIETELIEKNGVYILQTNVEPYEPDEPEIWEYEGCRPFPQ